MAIPLLPRILLGVFALQFTLLADPVTLTIKTQLLPPANDVANGYGKAVACNERYIVVGAPGAALTGGSNQGAVYVYDANTCKLVRKLRAPQPANSEKFGSTLALDGSLLYVGAPGHSGGGANAGAVHAYDLASGARKWTFVSTSAGEELGGYTLAVAADVVAVGQPNVSNQAGHVRLIHRRLAVLMSTVTAPNAKAGDRCGFALASSGHFLAVGVPHSDVGGSDNGLVLMVNARSPYFTAETFQPQSSSGCGLAVALNGPRLWVNALGGLMRFKPIDGTLGASLSEPPASSAEFAMVLATNGNLVACADSQRSGGAKVYGYDLDSAIPLWELNDPNATPSSRFGRAVALSSRHVVVGDGVGFDQVAVAELPVLPWHPQRIKQIITSGASAPGTVASFAAVTKVEAAVNTQGEVLASANLAKGDATAFNNNGLWSTMTGPALVARTGDKLGAQKLIDVGAPIINGSDRALFLARVSGTNARVLMEDQGAAAVEVLREGVPVLSGRVLNRIHQVVQPFQGGVPSGANRFAMVGSYRPGIANVTAGNDTAVFSSASIGTVSEMAREGNPSPNMNLPYGQMLPRLGRSGSVVIFSAGLQEQDPAYNACLFLHTIGTGTQAVAGKGDIPNQVPEPKARLRSFLGESCYGNGRFVFRASMSGVSVSGNEGIWANLNNPTANQLLIRKGWPAVGLPAGIYVSRFLRVFMTGDNVIVWATLRGATVNSSNNHAVWRFTHNGPELLLRTGDPAPGCGGARYGRILSVDAGEAGSYSIQSTLTGCPASHNVALFENTMFTVATGFQRQPQLAARKGMVIDRAGPKKITSLVLGRGSVDATGFGNKGLGNQVCGLGVLFGARFSDGSSQLLFGRQ